MNLFVQPSKAFSVLADDTELSIARIVVVPTQQIRFLLVLALLTMSQASCFIFN